MQQQPNLPIPSLKLHELQIQNQDLVIDEQSADQTTQSNGPHTKDESTMSHSQLIKVQDLKQESPVRVKGGAATEPGQVQQDNDENKTTIERAADMQADLNSITCLPFKIKEQVRRFRVLSVKEQTMNIAALPHISSGGHTPRNAL